MTGLLRFFGESQFSATQVRNGKPAPDLFLFAAHSMGVDPEQCVVIEDSAIGIRAARVAEMTAVGFIAGSHLPPNAADHLCDAGADTLAARSEDLPAAIQEAWRKATAAR